MRKALARFLFGLFGWKVVGGAPEVPKAVLVVAPHTSSWDFIVGVFSRAILGMQIKFIGKESLFRPPFGWLFRRLGGYPVKRTERQDTVKFVVDLFNAHDSFYFSLSPEGTRQRTEQLRTGFYSIAKGAGVPIILVGFDYAKREVQMRPPFYPTEDQEADFAYILGYFRTVTGKHPERGVH